MAGKVLIGCKLPNGYILELIERHANSKEMNLLPLPAGPRVTLNGANSARIIADSKNPTMGRFGMTEVDADFWAAWVKLYPDHVSLKNGHIFVVNNQPSFASAAKEREENRTLLEPLNMWEKGKDPRVNRSASPDTENMRVSR